MDHAQAFHDDEQYRTIIVSILFKSEFFIKDQNRHTVFADPKQFMRNLILPRYYRKINTFG